MSDHQIHDGYERLSSALAPPPDALARVDRRLRTRRRRRRTAVGGAAVLALTAIGGGALALTGGADDTTPTTVATDAPAPTPEPTPAPAGFTLTRPDGTTITFGPDQLDLRCRGAGRDITKGPGQRLLLTSPQVVDASGRSLSAPFFYVEALVPAADGRTFALPFESDSGATEDRPLTVFLADAGKDGNEVSSAEDGASGTVRVLRASCDPTPVLELEVDGTLGSEVEQPPFAITGSYR